VNIFRSGMTKLIHYPPVLSSTPLSSQSLGPALSISGALCQSQSRNFASISNPAYRSVFSNSEKSSSSLPALTSIGSTSGLLNGCLSPVLTQIRTNVRIFFPRPREYKRITHAGWKTRMSTPSGRRIIMRRILKNRHSLSH